MALQMAKTLNNGLTGDHWQLTQAQFNNRLGTLVVVYDLWMDAATAADLTKVSMYQEKIIFGQTRYVQIMALNGGNPTPNDIELECQKELVFQGSTQVPNVTIMIPAQ